VRVIRGVLGETDAELGTLLQAPEDEVDAESPLPLHVGPVGTNVVFLLQFLGLERLRIRPLDGDTVVAGECLDPLLVRLRPFGQGLFGNRVHPMHVTEKMHDVLWAGQQRQVALNDDAIETVVYKQEQAAKQLVVITSDF